MQHVLRFTAVLAVTLAWPLRAEPSAGTSQYRQADTNFYLKSDVLNADSNAVILTPDAVANVGGVYSVPGRHRHADGIVYLQQMRDWIEPITPPSMPASLNIPGNAMQVREPQGSVQVALPSAPADFHSVEDGMTLPNGSVLKTGDNGSVAVLFGGVDSVRLAPDSQAAVQMTVTAERRDAEVDIQDGIVFSKVGQRIGEKESYEVKTPFGTATAHGTDFVTVVLPHRVDVWVAEGTVELAPPRGSSMKVSVTGNGAFRVMRFPGANGDANALVEGAETLTTILNFIPMANQKLKRLSERTHSGDRLTATEQAYVGRIRKIPALIRLEPLAPGAAPIAPIVPLTPPGPGNALPTTLQPIVTPRASHVPRPKSSEAEMREEEASVENSARKSMQAKAAVAKEKESSKPAHPRTVVEKTSKNAATKPAVAKVAKNEKVKAAQTNEVSKPKPAKVAEEAKPKPSAEPAYPRAKPVSAAELAQPASVAPRPTPVKNHAVESDPNSLGAPLNPYVKPVARPAPPARADGTQSATSTSGKSAAVPNDTVP